MYVDFLNIEKALAHTEHLLQEERKRRREAEASRDTLLAFVFSKYLDNPEGNLIQKIREEKI